uniref:Uncharacterized protein n=1 Tax=Timema poppense TaxID=170557 RepID=A0A7R9CPI9_TIMPO|nr:unnamed protein product [Timema poppensis]
MKVLSWIVEIVVKFLNMRTQLSTMPTFLVWTLKFNIGLGAIWRFPMNAYMFGTANMVWYYALEQAMYSVGVALGPLIMFGSYACVRRDVRFNIILSCVLVIILSVLASMFVFEILGIKASASDERPHFVFVVYSEAFNLIAAAPNITRALFYFVFVTTAASNSFTTIIVIVSSIDKFAPKLCHKIGYNNTYFIVMGILFMLSIPCVTKVSIYSAFTAMGSPLHTVQDSLLDRLLGAEQGTLLENYVTDGSAASEPAGFP